jgi:hypothetical protein
MGWELRQSPSAQLFDLPIIGGDLAKVGRIINIYATPCSPYVEVWVYAFWQAIPTLFITLTKPELIDISIHKGNHKPRRGKKARFRASAIFRDALIEVPVPSWRVFRIYEFFQRIGYYFLVADALEDFSINWLSMAYKMQGCNQTPFAYFRGEMNHHLMGSGAAPGYYPINYNTIALDNIDSLYPPLRPAINGTYRVTWSATFTPYGVPEQSEIPVTTTLLVDSQDATVGEMSSLGAGRSFASGNATIEVLGPPFPIFNLTGLFTQANKACYVDGTYAIDRTQDDEIAPDP